MTVFDVFVMFSVRFMYAAWSLLLAARTVMLMNVSPGSRPVVWWFLFCVDVLYFDGFCVVCFEVVLYITSLCSYVLIFMLQYPVAFGAICCLLSCIIWFWYVLFTVCVCSVSWYFVRRRCRFWLGWLWLLCSRLC